MQLAAENKAGYLNSFWKNRLASLLIPMVVINIVCYAIKYFLSDSPEAVMLVYLDRYVAVLFSYCLWFWCLEMLAKHLPMPSGLLITTAIALTVILAYIINLIAKPLVEKARRVKWSEA